MGSECQGFKSLTLRQFFRNLVFRSGQSVLLASALRASDPRFESGAPTIMGEESGVTLESRGLRGWRSHSPSPAHYPRADVRSLYIFEVGRVSPLSFREGGSVRLNPRLIPYPKQGLSMSNVLFRWFDAGVTPLTIPNREVKLGSSDGTRKGRVASRRNRVFDFTQKAPLWWSFLLLFKQCLLGIEKDSSSILVAPCYSWLLWFFLLIFFTNQRLVVLIKN